MKNLYDRRRRVEVRGFSLIEVVLAVGVLAFAILPIIAFLPIGLTNYKGSVWSAKAAQAASEIATCVQLATPLSTSGTTYTALAPFNTNANGSTNITWSPSTVSPATATHYGPIYFDENGIPTTSNSSARLVAMIAITPPTSVTPFTPGTAYIYVGWPGAGGSTITWSSNVVTYPNELGHEELTLPINPSTFQ
jgi:Tfp pilus assembly protein PilV